MTQRERYRLTANLGHCADASGRGDEATRLYAEASTYQPEDPPAIYLGAIANYRSGDVASAAEKLNVLKSSAPQIPQTWSLHIKLADPHVSMQDLESQIPRALLSDADVLWNLAHAAFNRQDFKKARAFNKQAHASADISHPCATMDIRCLLNELAAEISSRNDPTLTSIQREDLQEGLGKIDQLLETTRLRLIDSARSEALMLRSKLHHALDNRESALRDAEDAWKIEKAFEETASHYGILLSVAGQTDRALEVVDGILAKSHQARVLLAQCHHNVGNLSDRALSIQALLRELDTDAKKTGDPTTLIYYGFLCQGTISPQRALQDFQDQATASSLNPTLVHALRGILLENIDEMRLARAEALASMPAIADVVPSKILRHVAQILYKTDCFAESFELYRNIISPGVADRDIYFFIDAADRAGNSVHALHFLKALRENGIYRFDLIQKEVHLLDKYNDYETAELVLRDSIPAFSKNDEQQRHLRLNRSLLGHRLHRHEWITPDINLLPQATMVSPEAGEAVGAILSYAPDAHIGIRYTYHLLRRYPSSDHAHRAFFRSFRIGNNEAPPPPTHQSVVAGVSVYYVENGETTRKHLCIIGPDHLPDGYQADPSRNEQSPDGPLASLFLGRSIEATIEVHPGLNCRIVAIQDIWSFRLMDVMENYETRFPGFFVRRFSSTDDSGNPDFSPIIRMGQEQGNRAGNAFKLYQELDIPVAMVAENLSHSITRTMLEIGSRENWQIKCANNTAVDNQIAKATLDALSQIIITPTALGTLFNTQCYQWIAIYPGTFFITQSTLAEFKEGCHKATVFSLPENLDFTAEINWKKHASQPDRDFPDSVQAYCDFIQKHATLVPGTALASLDGETQQRWRQAFGNAGAESLACARNMDAVLWSDDIIERSFAWSDAKIQGTWSQFLHSRLIETSLIDDDQQQNLAIRLKILRYGITNVSPKTFLYALRKSSWCSTTQEFDALMVCVSDERMDDVVVAPFIAGILRNVWKESPFPHLAETVTIRILTELIKRKKGRAIIQVFLKMADYLFEIDVISAHKFKGVAQVVLFSNPPPSPGIIIRP